MAWAAFDALDPQGQEYFRDFCAVNEGIILWDSNSEAEVDDAAHVDSADGDPDFQNRYLTAGEHAVLRERAMWHEELRVDWERGCMPVGPETKL